MSETVTPINSSFNPDQAIQMLCEQSRKNNYISPEKFPLYQVKRGLRNADGSGVIAGLTRVCNVHGYVMNEGEKSPEEGLLVYRGYNLEDLVNACHQEDRFGFEEIAWLLLFGQLPTKEQLGHFTRTISHFQTLPDSFVDDVIIKHPSANIMNTLQRATLALYSFDDNPEDQSLENVMQQAISIIAKMPIFMSSAYQAKRRAVDKKSMYFHQPRDNLSVAENILRMMRSHKRFTDAEAKMLDICLLLHAEHGGGNNSTFATRVLTSSGTDTYSAIAASIGSLKGFRHGGANAKVMSQLDTVKAGVSNWEDQTEIESFLEKIMDKKAGDGSGLIYGMGHAVYTISDPRAKMLKKYAERMVAGTEHEKEYRLIENIEKLAPGVFARKKNTDAPLCANVDLYSGMVYSALRLPPETYTPLFAVARTVGWCAHRIEEIQTAGSKIIRPAYRPVIRSAEYLPLSSRS
jgi:Citrate synthase